MEFCCYIVTSFSPSILNISRIRSYEDFFVWHIITGEYPPQLGGVSDYTYQISRALSKEGHRVHVWWPATESEALDHDGVKVHPLPGGFGWRWLRELDRRLRSFPEPRNILIQYVPHMYGWKSMNLAFCLWILLQRRQNVCVMFHEVAFPFRSGQPLRHSLLALVHRAMAWTILRSVRHSFTSTDPYMNTLRTLGSTRTPISLLRICSNIPMESYQPDRSREEKESVPNELFTVGIFSNFSAELRETLAPALGCILDNTEISVLLLGPGESFRQSLAQQHPHAADRIRTTGRLPVSEIGAHMRRCDALLQLYPDGASAARGTLVGAIASGVPVVTTAGPLTDRVLLDSGALLFAKPSPDSIKNAIELLGENPALGQELQTRALRLYKDLFQPAVIISKIRNAVAPSHNRDLEPEMLHR